MPRKSLKKQIRYFFEAILVFIILSIFKILPFDLSSKLAGYIAEKFGALSKTNLILRKNLRLAFPKKSQTELMQIEHGAWRNLGNLAGESAQLGKLKDEFNEIIEYKGLENLENARKNNTEKPSGIILVSGHMGNWEIGARIVAEIEPNINFIYRTANNKFVENIIQKLRTPYLKNIIAKGSSDGVKGIIKHLKIGGSLAMLVDQKFSGGSEVEFFGQKVTAPDTHADFAIKFNIPIIPTRIIRLPEGRTDGKKFIAEFLPAINIDNKNKQQITQDVYKILQTFITEYPEQWFWMHNRFGLKR